MRSHGSCPGSVLELDGRPMFKVKLRNPFHDRVEVERSIESSGHRHPDTHSQSRRETTRRRSNRRAWSLLEHRHLPLIFVGPNAAAESLATTTVSSLSLTQGRRSIGTILGDRVSTTQCPDRPDVPGDRATFPDSACRVDRSHRPRHPFGSADAVTAAQASLRGGFL